MTDNTEGFISLSKIAYKAAPSTTPDLQTVRFLVRLFTIVREHVKEDDCNFCRKILIEASHDDSSLQLLPTDNSSHVH